MNKDFEDVFEYAMKRVRTLDMPIFVPRVRAMSVKQANKGIDKVIFEKDCCVIVDTNGDRYIARPEKCDKYDKEKGFLIALAKYNGFTTTKIQQLIEGAIVKNAKKSTKTCHCDKKVVKKSTKKN